MAKARPRRKPKSRAKYAGPFQGGRLDLGICYGCGKLTYVRGPKGKKLCTRCLKG